MAIDPIPCGAYAGDGPSVVRALPARYYTEPSIFEEERKRIFYGSWQCLGHVSMVPEPGSFFVGKVVDQEILIVRGEDDRIRSFYNVCRHRGHRLAEGSGRRQRLVCPYHAWTYGLDGGLRTAPHSARIPAFKAQEIRLSQVRLEVFCGLIFVCLDPGTPALETMFGELESDLLHHKPNVASQQHVCDIQIVHECNWKVTVENFSECYHCAPVHKYLVESVIDPKAYRLEAKGFTQRHRIGARDSEAEQHIWYFWPNTVAGLYPVPGFGTTFGIRHWYPLGHDRTIFHFRWFSDPGAPRDAIADYARRHAETTGAEDAAVTAGVQKGMGSLGFTEGMLLADPASPATSEHALAQFHRLVLDALGVDAR